MSLRPRICHALHQYIAKYEPLIKGKRQISWLGFVFNFLISRGVIAKMYSCSMSSGTVFHINWNGSPCYMEQKSNLAITMLPNVMMATKAHFAGFDSLMFGTYFLATRSAHDGQRPFFPPCYSSSSAFSLPLALCLAKGRAMPLSHLIKASRHCLLCSVPFTSLAPKPCPPVA